MDDPSTPLEPYAPPITDESAPPPITVSASLGWPSLLVAIAATWVIGALFPDTSPWVLASATAAPLVAWFVSRIAVGAVNERTLFSLNGSRWWVFLALPIMTVSLSGFAVGIWGTHDALSPFDRGEEGVWVRRIAEFKFADSYPYWLIASVVDELVFRGVLLTPCVTRYGRGKGIALTLALEWASGGGPLVGLIASLLYLRTRSLPLTLAAHVVGACLASALGAWAVPYVNDWAPHNLVLVAAIAFLAGATLVSVLAIRRLPPSPEVADGASAIAKTARTP